MKRHRFVLEYQNRIGSYYPVGTEIELTDTTAAWLLADMPGCIELMKPDEKRTADAPEHHRQLTAPPRKRTER